MSSPETPRQLIKQLHRHRFSVQTVQNCLRNDPLRSRLPCCGLDLIAVCKNSADECIACLTLEAGGGYCVVMASVLLMSVLWEGVPWCWWDYGLSRPKLQTTNTVTLYWQHYECAKLSWWDPRCRHPAIHPLPSLHVAEWSCTAPCCKDLYPTPESLEHSSSYMAQLLTQVSMTGIVWIDSMTSDFSSCQCLATLDSGVDRSGVKAHLCNIHAL